MNHYVKIEELVKQFGLKTLTKFDHSKKETHHAEVNRLALQLTGFFEYFETDRIQLIGLVEYSYLNGIGEDRRVYIFEELMKCNFPCIIFSRGLSPHPELLYFAEKYGVPVFSTMTTSSEFIYEVIKWLKVRLAPRLMMHGSMVDVYGEGLLILGESGIGKSETLLELIKRGHRFVADDAVEIKKVSNSTLIGSCPELTQYFIELRGIGIINVQRMFGVQSVKLTQTIDFVIKLVNWENAVQKDRLGLEDEYIDILGNKVVCHEIPVRPGRNLAIICEAASINHRQKRMGDSAAHNLFEKSRENGLKG